MCAIQLPAEEAVTRDTSSSALAALDQPSASGPLDDAVLQNNNQFYKWHSELEVARTLETEQKYRLYAVALEGHLQTCNHILNKVCCTWSLDLFHASIYARYAAAIC